MIIRVRKSKNYTAIPNAVYQNNSYSLEMRGAHISLITKPNDWVLRNTNLEKLWGVGHNTVQKILKEMEANGLISRVKKHKGKGDKDGGKFEWERIVYESPDLNPNWRDKRRLPAPATMPKPAAALELISHPAIKAMREICGTSGNKIQRENIVNVVGDSKKSLSAWEQVLTKFMVEGQPKNRVDYMLERFAIASNKRVVQKVEPDAKIQKKRQSLLEQHLNS